jgi:hypothetical protein
MAKGRMAEMEKRPQAKKYVRKCTKLRATAAPFEEGSHVADACDMIDALRAARQCVETLVETSVEREPFVRIVTRAENALIGAMCAAAACFVDDKVLFSPRTTPLSFA